MGAIEKSLEKIKVMHPNERVPVLWGVCQGLSDENKLKYSGKQLYVCWDVLKVDKQKNGKYSFCSDIFYSGHELIRECAEKLGYCKWTRLFGFRLEFTYEQLREVLYKIYRFKLSYEGSIKMFKKCFYTEKEALAYRDELNAPLIKEDKEKHIAEIRNEMPELLEKKSDEQEKSVPIKLFRKKRI